MVTVVVVVVPPEGMLLCKELQAVGFKPADSCTVYIAPVVDVHVSVNCEVLRLYWKDVILTVGRPRTAIDPFASNSLVQLRPPERPGRVMEVYCPP